MTSKINIDGKDYDLSLIKDRSLIMEILTEKMKGCNQDYVKVEGDFRLSKNPVCIHDYEGLRKTMQGVFDECIVIAQNACDKKGNTDKPWLSFSVRWLQKRLDDELNEYYSKKRTGRLDWIELKDVINMACFLYLAHQKEWLYERTHKTREGNRSGMD